MHLAAAFALNDHTSADKADPCNDALNDPAGRGKLLAVASSL